MPEPHRSLAPKAMKRAQTAHSTTLLGIRRGTVAPMDTLTMYIRVSARTARAHKTLLIVGF